MQSDQNDDMFTGRPLRLVPPSEIPVQNISVASRAGLAGLYPKGRALKKTSILSQLIQLLIVAILGLLAYWLISHKVLQSVQVEGRSMVPTLQPSENYFLNKWIYAIRSPERDDIVVIKDPSDAVWEVKRVIATAGESVYIKKGAVYVNGERLKEPYLAPGTKTYAAETADEFTCCGADQVYVLGDNRGISRDSRYFGAVTRENIVGKLIH